MNGLLFLLYCIEILGALLCGVKGNPEVTSGETDWDEEVNDETSSVKQESSSTSPYYSTSAASNGPDATLIMNTEIFTTESLFFNRPSTKRSPGPQQPTITATSSPIMLLFKKECLTVYLVAGGLIVGCSILLLSTLLLTWKVWQLRQYIKILSCNGDLISNSEYWMGTAKKNKKKSDPQAKETCMLMADMSQTQEDTTNDNTKEEEGGKPNEDEQKEAEDKQEVDDTAKSEEASASENKKETSEASVESPSSSKP